MKCSSTLLIIALTFFALPSSVKPQQDFEEWKQQQQQEFQQFQDARDKEFMKYLQQEWEDFQTYQGLVRDETPKPKNIPTAETEPEITPEKPDAPKVSPPPTLEPAPSDLTPTAPQPPRTPEEPEKYQTIEFQFFGTPVQVKYDRQIGSPVEENIDQESISGFWKSLGTADTKSLIDHTEEYRKSLKLNDWGYAIFVHHLGENLYENSPNSATLFAWFMLLKSGYDVRVGYYEDTVYLLLPSENTLYSIPFLTIAGTKYYIMPLDGRSSHVKGITTYKEDYPGKSRPISFRLDASPAITENRNTREFRFEYLGEQYTIEVPVNRNITEFYDTYPQADIPIYFQSAMSPHTAKSLVEELRPVIADETETRAVNLLLRFVQTAFKYQTDAQQFGKENYLFPEETLYYPASDCEDRSALFAYLVRNLLGLEVIGLDYPGHIATAVKFSSDVGRDSITYDGQTYTICDPTYIKAEYGMTMPVVQDKKVAVFTFD
ncbi:MAG: hypothetical protein MAGBODY4_01008 [Candidatus Marinimicrobia bacterium]|nr:hypothetical protein [Candidatus Neomarinimicrobiota bacterium]